MIQKIQKIFHTDKLLGKIVVIFLTYFLYWCVFYGSWFLIPQTFFYRNNNLSGLLFILYIFIIVPIISFFIPKLLRKIFKINNIFLYSLHLFLIILSVVVFMGIGILIALSHFSIG